MSCILEYGTSEHKALVDEELIESMISSKGQENELSRALGARALVILRRSRLHPQLLQLMEDSSPVVVRQIIESTAQTRDRQLVPWLLSKLADKRFRAPARSALASFGTRVLGTLTDHLTDKTVELSLRVNIPRVFVQIPRQQSVDMLTASIKELDSPVKYAAVKALNKLRARYRELRFDGGLIEDVLIEETKSYYEILQIFYFQQQEAESPRAKLLRRALAERLDHNLELIFRLLSLRYPPRDMYGAYYGIISDKKQVRASAVEFLDNVLGKGLKSYMIPFLDPISPEVMIQKGRELFGLHIESREEGISLLIQGTDDWLRACAIYNVGPNDPSELLKLVEESRSDPNPLIRETAESALVHPRP